MRSTPTNPRPRFSENEALGLLSELYGLESIPDKAEDTAEIGYSMLIGLRTAAFFDSRLKLSRARRLFHDELSNLAGL